MSPTKASRSRPEQAIDARRRSAQAKAAAVDKALKTLARSGAPITRAAVARAAGVSRSFTYENPQARDRIAEAQAKTQARAADHRGNNTAQQEASWRERALNAEDQLRNTSKELAAQRRFVADLLGQLRDPDGTWIAEERARLHQQNEQLLAERDRLAGERNDLQRKLDAARTNLAHHASQRVTELFPQGPGRSASA
jgi:chromosome segregation ATPase